MQNKTFDSERRSARFARMMDRLRSREWIVPTAMVLLAIGLSFAMEALDEHVKGRLDPVWYLFSGGHTIARQFLSALAAAMVAILTMAFSITVTALTFIGQHYGSRVLRSFMQDLRTQLVIGTFLATFVYALLVLRTVHSASHDSSLPRISVTFAIVLAVVSLFILTYFLYHLSERMDAPNIVASIAHDLDRVIDRTTQARVDIGPSIGPSGEECPPEPPITAAYRVQAMDTGYVQRIDEEALIKAAASHEAMVQLHCRAGAFVIEGDTLATVRSEPRTEKPLCILIRASIRLGAARSLEQDVEFGIDQLVQVAIRGLSPGRNDTFTVMLCLDRIAAALNRLAERDFPPSTRRDRDGCPRLWICRMRFPDLADRAFEQIHSFGGETAAVSIRLLETIKAIARRVNREEDREALRRHAREVNRASRTALQDSMGIEAIERAFTDTMRTLERNPQSPLASEKRG